MFVVIRKRITFENLFKRIDDEKSPILVHNGTDTDFTCIYIYVIYVALYVYIFP